MKKMLFFLLVVSTGLSNVFAQQTIFVSGEIDILKDDEQVSLMRLNGNDEIVAEANSLKQRFELEFQTDQSDLYSFSFGDDDGFVIVLHPGNSVQIYMNEAEIIIKGSIENSKNAVLMMESNSLVEKYNLLYSEYLVTEVEGRQGQIEDEITIIMEQYTKLIKGFIKENPGSLLSLLYLEELNIDYDFEYFALASDSLKPKYPDNVHVVQLNRKVEAKKRTAIGNPAPEIEMPGPDGNNLKLSDLKGNIVLVDFWASWCRPCRQESPNMVRLHDKYSKSGLIIFGVSLDKERENWLEAIETDKLSWLHVSELKGWESVVCEDYSIGGIPNTALIDKEGKIIATGLRGEALEEKLVEIFGF